MNVCHCPKKLSEPYEVTASEEYVDNGRVLKRAVSKTVDPALQNKGVSVSDFYLENIIAVGAVDSLHECKLSESVLCGTDNVDAQLSSIDSYA